MSPAQRVMWGRGGARERKSPTPVFGVGLTERGALRRGTDDHKDKLWTRAIKAKSRTDRSARFAGGIMPLVPKTGIEPVRSLTFAGF